MIFTRQNKSFVPDSLKRRILLVSMIIILLSNLQTDPVVRFYGQVKSQDNKIPAVIGP